MDMQCEKYIWFDNKEIISARDMLEYFLKKILISGDLFQSLRRISEFIC